MCGIILAIANKKNKNIAKAAFCQYENQHARGSQGFGIIAIGSDGKAYRQRFTEEKHTIFALGNLAALDCKEILLHHRYPTSTNNTLKTAHPFFTNSPAYEFNYYFCHNGVIQNDENLRDEHKKINIDYESETITQKKEKTIIEFNDSEALMHDFLLTYEGKQKEMKSKGWAAFIAYKLDKKTGEVIERITARNEESPLQTRTKKGITLIASAIDKRDSIAADTLFIHNFKTKKTKEQPLKIGDCSKTRAVAAVSSFDIDEWQPADSDHYTKNKMGFLQDEETEEETADEILADEINQWEDFVAAVQEIGMEIAAGDFGNLETADKIERMKELKKARDYFEKWDSGMLETCDEIREQASYYFQTPTEQKRIDSEKKAIPAGA